MHPDPRSLLNTTLVPTHCEAVKKKITPSLYPWTLVCAFAADKMIAIAPKRVRSLLCVKNMAEMECIQLC